MPLLEITIYAVNVPTKSVLEKNETYTEKVGQKENTDFLNTARIPRIEPSLTLDQPQSKEEFW